MKIGAKIKELRLSLNLTQEELASRTELSKGFISQLERDLTSPSIATLIDILEALGTNLTTFFQEKPEEKVVFTSRDVFVKEDAEAGTEIHWLVTSAQKNDMEPIMLILAPGASSAEDDPHEGEEFGYMLAGTVTLTRGANKWKLKRGDSFYIRANAAHSLENRGKTEARVLWVSTPPSF